MDVPYSKRDEMTDKEPMIEEWLENHPAPSWEVLAWALYRRGDGRIYEHSTLKQLYEKYITGMSMFVQIIEVDFSCLLKVPSEAITVCMKDSYINAEPICQASMTVNAEPICIKHQHLVISYCLCYIHTPQIIP